MTEEKKALFIIFGGTGDLARRKLYPSLYRLYKKGFLRTHFAVIGTARREWTDEYYQSIVQDAIEDIQVSKEDAEEFSSHFRYQSHNVKDTAHYVKLKKLSDELDTEYGLQGNRLFYLSMSPSFFGLIAEHLKSQELKTTNGFNRLIIEKPFGEDYQSAEELNDHLQRSFEEEQIYRIDHYLGKEMVQSIPAVRFGNPFLMSVWNKDFIQNIQITLSEALGVEERGGFYDHTGALKDMVQNHILQLIALLAMEPPAEWTPDAIRTQKVAALEAIERPSSDEVARSFVRGQYGKADTPEGFLKGYREEDQVETDSATETFAAGKIQINTDRFQGVPFYFRTGKRMVSKTARIDIVLKHNGHSPFGEQKDVVKNVLTCHLDPEQGWSFLWNDKKIGPGMQLQSGKLTHFLSKEETEKMPEAYEKLLLDALNGDPTHFAHWEEVAASWKFVDPIRQTWDAEKPDFPNYDSRTTGPAASLSLPEKDGNEWIWKGSFG